MRKKGKPHRLSNLAMGMVQFLFLTGPVTAQIPCSYDVQIIQGPWCGEIFGFPPTFGKGISESGAVVGSYNSCVIGPSEAFFWTEETGLITLERPQGYTDAGAEDIDSATGWIVGALQTPGTDGPFAAVWADGKVFDLGTMPGGDFSNARAIASDPNPIIVGKWGNENLGPIHGFVWQDGVMTDLGSILKADGSRAEDVNAHGSITGWMRKKPGGERIAYLLDDGVVTILGPIPGGLTSEGRAINGAGAQVVGGGNWMDPDTGMIFGRAFSYANSEMINLGTLPGHLASYATDVSDQGVVIGSLAGGAAGGFIWYEGTMVDVNTLLDSSTGVQVSGCSAINSQGQIAAGGHDAKGDVVALLLTPVEPPLGDIDMDCAVGVKDLLILLGRWGPCGDCDDCSADLDANCIVGVNDLLLLLANWG